LRLSLSEGDRLAGSASEESFFAGPMVPTLLIVDDSRTVRTLARQACLTQGWHLLEAVDVPQGLKSAERVPVDLILLDTTLRGLEVTEALRAFRSHASTESTPIVLLAPSLGQGHVPPLARAQAQALLAKPFSRSDLDRTLSHWLVRPGASAPAPAVHSFAPVPSRSA
jgi:chemosensory pili system protein ChpA (sensor histidine kinase/response regulator)